MVMEEDILSPRDPFPGHPGSSNSRPRAVPLLRGGVAANSICRKSLQAYLFALINFVFPDLFWGLGPSSHAVTTAM